MNVSRRSTLKISLAGLFTFFLKKSERQVDPPPMPKPPQRCNQPIPRQHEYLANATSTCVVMPNLFGNVRGTQF